MSALRRLHRQRQEAEADFHRDLHSLERATLRNRLRPVYERRARIVRGDPEGAAGGAAGVPLFWAHAMLCSRTVRNIVQPHDVAVLGSLLVGCIIVSNFRGQGNVTS